MIEEGDEKRDGMRDEIRGAECGSRATARGSRIISGDSRCVSRGCCEYASVDP